MGDTGLELIEIAPGLDVERDVISRMDFRPAISRDLKAMNASIVSLSPMGLGVHVHAETHRYRSRHVEQWHAARCAGAR